MGYAADRDDSMHYEMPGSGAASLALKVFNNGLSTISGAGLSLRRRRYAIVEVVIMVWNFLSWFEWAMIQLVIM